MEVRCNESIVVVMVMKVRCTEATVVVIVMKGRRTEATAVVMVMEVRCTNYPVVMVMEVSVLMLRLLSWFQIVILKELNHSDWNFNESQRIELNSVSHRLHSKSVNVEWTT